MQGDTETLNPAFLPSGWKLIPRLQWALFCSIQSNSLPFLSLSPLPHPSQPGLFCRAPGQSAASDQCSAGYYCVSGASSPTPEDGGLTGHTCPEGHYCPRGSGAPLPCPQGHYSAAAGNTGLSDCLPCPAGGLGCTGSVWGRLPRSESKPSRCVQRVCLMTEALRLFPPCRLPVRQQRPLFSFRWLPGRSLLSPARERKPAARANQLLSGVQVSTGRREPHALPARDLPEPARAGKRERWLVCWWVGFRR